MKDPIETVDAYFAMWNEGDPARRAKHIREAWAPGGRYVDPLIESAGHEALSAMVATVHHRFPGHRFRRTSGVDRHHDVVRFHWDLMAPDGAIVVAGIDVGWLAPDGRLQAVTGFFGDVPALVAA
ncbi:MAG: nuclear transport factor 2 family protein [Dehalococcoidia bacterium]